MRVIGIPICAYDFEEEGITGKRSKQPVHIQNLEVKMEENILRENGIRGN